MKVKRTHRNTHNTILIVECLSVHILPVYVVPLVTFGMLDRRLCELRFHNL